MPIGVCAGCGKTVAWTHHRGDRIKGLGHWDVNDITSCRGELVLPPSPEPEHPVVQCPREHRDYRERFQDGALDAFETTGRTMPRKPVPIARFSADTAYLARCYLAMAAYLEGYNRAVAKLAGLKGGEINI